MRAVTTRVRLAGSKDGLRGRDGVTKTPAGTDARRRPAGRSRRRLALALPWLFAAPAALFSQQLHVYAVPVPEEQIRNWAVAIDQGALGVSDEIHTVISLTATLDSTVIRYDHWEDGFENDLANPLQASTEVWGDGDCANGFTPLVASCVPGVDDALDVVMGGDVIALENDVPANPRDPTMKFWDGGDTIAASNLLVVTRAGWPTQVGAQSGVVLAGAVEVYAATDWGTAFESPVGEDILTEDMFEYTALAIMARTDDTFVEVDADRDGTSEIGQWLQAGESLLAEGIAVGATVEATQPVQVDLLTGDVGTTYEGRWFALAPTAQWSDVYYSPVGQTNGAAPVSVIAYNPGASDLDVAYDSLSGGGSFTVPAGGIYEFTMPTNSGARFAAVGTSATLAPVKDGWIRQDKDKENYGSCTTIRVDREATKPERSLLQFDLSAIPAGATITSAQLTLTKLSGNADIDVSVLRMTADWDEGAQCGSAGQASWNDRQPGVPWSVAGGDFAGPVVDTVNIVGNGAYAWNVAPLVQDWVDGTFPNQGLIVKVHPESGGDRSQAFASRENAIAGDRPRLSVTYTLPSPSSGSAFYAVSTIDVDSSTHDWGFSLLPESSLATAAQAGWAPGSSDLTANGSPVWVTAEADTTLYVDFDGDGTPDTTSPLGRLQSLRLFDSDNDQTGMRLYTTDGTRIAAAWGQDPGTAGPGSPYLDLGTTVLPFVNPLLAKDVELFDDVNGNGVIEPGDTLRYTLRIKNVSAADFVDGVLLDEPDPNTTYVVSTTEVDGTPIADDASPATPYPLDEAGYALPTPIAPGQTVVVTYQMVVDDPLPPGVFELVNNATVTAGDASTSATASSTVLLARLRLRKTSDAVGQVSPGQIIHYTATVENVSSVTQTGIRVTDFLPLGTTYVAESTVATTPSVTLDNVPGGANPDLQDGSLPDLVLAADGIALDPGEILTVTYALQVDDPLDPEIEGIFNYARACSAEMPQWVSDSTFNEAPTVAVVAAFAAYVDGGGVVVEWETASEVGTAGFYLYRWDARRREHVLVDEALLPAAPGAPQGAVYRLRDEGAPLGARLEYALVEVEAGGGERTYGPFRPRLDWSRERPELRGRSQVAPREASARGRERARRARAAAVARAATPVPDRSASGSRAVLGRPEVRLELTTRDAGVYRLDAETLAAGFGVPVAAIRSRIAKGGLTLENRGREVSWWAEPDASALGFYGEAIDSPYTLDNVYWLSLGRGPSPASRGVRQEESLRSFGSGLSISSPFAAEATFPEHLHFEQDRIPGLVSARDPEADWWFWEGIAAGDPTQGRKSFSLSAPAPAWESGAPAELSIAVESVSDTPSSSDHHLAVRLNGSWVGETRWDGAVPHQAAFEVPLSLLREGENTVEVEGLLDGNAPYSLFFVDSFDLSYRRLYHAEKDRLLFTPDSGAAVTVAGFSSPSVSVYDVTEPARARPVASLRSADGRVRLEVAAGRTYLALGDLVLASPAVHPVAIDPRSDLRDPANAADYLLIAPDRLVEGAQALAELRRRDGLEARVVALEEIYRQLNHGLASPHAVASLLAYAHREWRLPPRYVVLVGDGSFDYKDRLGQGGNLVPPLMVGTPSGLFASDVALGDVGAADGPEIAVGRLPVLDAAELDAHVAKLAAYEAGVAAGHALLLADDPDAGGDYVATSEAIAALLADWQVTEVYLSREPLASARERLFATLERGVSLVNYVGHGGTTRLAHEGLLTDGDLPLVARLESPPVLAALTCVVGRFELPGYESLAESLLLEPEGGAIAVWAASGLSLESDAEILDRAFVAALRDGGVRLGDAVLAALRRDAAEGHHPFLWRTYNLLGDPALPLP